MKWEHLKILHRRAIASRLANKKKLVEIAEIVGLNPTSISKEFKRNHIKAKQGHKKTKLVNIFLDTLILVVDALGSIKIVLVTNISILLKTLKRRRV